MESVSAIILAGGRGTRLGGVNKALVEVGGRPIVARQLDVLRRLGAEVVAVANDDSLASFDVRIVPDVERQAGPLMGLYSGLRAAQGELCLVVACDMPLLSERLLRWLIEQAPGHDLVAPVIGGQPEPAHAVYRRAPCLGAAEAALARGDRRLISFWPEVRVRHVGEPELRHLDPELRSFFNVNTPADLEQAERWLTSDE